MRNDIAFQSQQFTEQVAQRRDRYAQQNIQSMQQIPQAAQSFINNYQNAQNQQMQAQEHQVNMAKAASSLASDELHRQQAQEELQWSQQLHQSDMLAMQKEAMSQDLALKKAQTQKAISDLGGAREYTGMDHTEQDYFIANRGLIGDGFGANFRIRPATDQEKSAASKRIKESQDYELQLKTAGRSAGRDPEMQQLTDMTRERQRLTQLKDAYDVWSKLSKPEQDSIDNQISVMNQEIQKLYDKKYGKPEAPKDNRRAESAVLDDIMGGLEAFGFGGNK